MPNPVKTVILFLRLYPMIIDLKIIKNKDVPKVLVTLLKARKKNQNFYKFSVQLTKNYSKFRIKTMLFITKSLSFKTKDLLNSHLGINLKVSTKEELFQISKVHLNSHNLPLKQPHT